MNDARSDIEALYPATPLSARAAGAMLLTWGLWNQGSSTYTLYAFAFDAEGRVASLARNHRRRERVGEQPFSDRYADPGGARRP